MKTLTDFRKTVETGVDPRLIFIEKNAGIFIPFLAHILSSKLIKNRDLEKLYIIQQM